MHTIPAICITCEAVLGPIYSTKLLTVPEMPTRMPTRILNPYLLSGGVFKVGGVIYAVYFLNLFGKLTYGRIAIYTIAGHYQMY